MQIKVMAVNINACNLFSVQFLYKFIVLLLLAAAGIWLGKL